MTKLPTLRPDRLVPRPSQARRQAKAALPLSIAGLALAALVSAGTAMAAQPGPTSITTVQHKVLAFNGANALVGRAGSVGIGTACPTLNVSPAPQPTVVPNKGPPTFTPWLNITMGH